MVRSVAVCVVVLMALTSDAVGDRARGRERVPLDPVFSIGNVVDGRYKVLRFLGATSELTFVEVKHLNREKTRGKTRTLIAVRMDGNWKRFRQAILDEIGLCQQYRECTPLQDSIIGNQGTPSYAVVELTKTELAELIDGTRTLGKKLPGAIPVSRWMWIPASDGIYLTYFYIDKTMGASAKGSRLRERPSRKELANALDAPTNTFRDPIKMGARSATPDEVTKLNLPERPGWLDVFEPAGDLGPVVPKTAAIGRPAAKKLRRR